MAVCPEESVTLAVKGNDPITVVVPAMAPLEPCNWIPEGNDPVVKLH